MDQQFFDLPVYGLDAADKSPLLIDALHELTRHHARFCPPYAKLLHAYGINPHIQPAHLQDFLPLTVRQFKLHQLKSITDDAVFKTLLSSGTSGSLWLKELGEKTFYGG